MVVNDTDVLEYKTSALESAPYSTESMLYCYETTEEAETATTDVISPEMILSLEIISKIIKELVEKIASVIDVNTLIEILERSLDEVNEIARIKSFEPFEEIHQEFEVPSWIKSIKKEYPEVLELSKKIKCNEKLTKTDEWNLNEIVEASGWDKEDIIEDLKNLDVDPSEREERYWDLFEKYYKEAKELKDKGDDVQAAEKLWGAITTLVKAYAAKKGILVEHWSKRKLSRVVANNVEDRLREKLEDLLTYGNELHEHFYERSLPPKTFERRWNQCIELIEDIKATIGT